MSSLETILNQIQFSLLHWSQSGSGGVREEALGDPETQHSLLAGASSVVGHIHESHPGVLAELMQRDMVLQCSKVAGQESFTFCLQHCIVLISASRRKETG